MIPSSLQIFEHLCFTTARFGIAVALCEHNLAKRRHYWFVLRPSTPSSLLRSLAERLKINMIVRCLPAARDQYVKGVVAIDSAILTSQTRRCLLLNSVALWEATFLDVYRASFRPSVGGLCMDFNWRDVGDDITRSDSILCCKEYNYRQPSLDYLNHIAHLAICATPFI